MPPRRNPLKLNALQLKTLAILQELAALPDCGRPHEATGGTLLGYLPQPHGDHFHIGKFTVPARAATGLFNDAVWKVLARKGLVDPDGPGAVTLTADGVAYDTGLAEVFDDAEHEEE